jgi:phosphatidylglycerol---prolipoprotein diacylglyceryl transferase
MHPFIALTPRITLDSWWVMMCAALLAGSLVSLSLLRKEMGWRRAGLVIPVMAWGALFGAHLGHYVFHPVLFRKDPLGVLVFWGDGHSFLGAPAFCVLLLAVLSTCVRGVRFWPTADAFALGVPAGLFFARLGCYLKGCCWGTPVSETHLFHGLAWKLIDNHLTALHPVQLYGSFSALVIFSILLAVRRRTETPGVLSAAFLLLYCTARFVLEFFRADSHGKSLFGLLTTHQEICLTLFPAACILLWIRLRKGRTI